MSEPQHSRPKQMRPGTDRQPALSVIIAMDNLLTVCLKLCQCCSYIDVTRVHSRSRILYRSRSVEAWQPS